MMQKRRGCVVTTHPLMVARSLKMKERLWEHTRSEHPGYS